MKIEQAPFGTTPSGEAVSRFSLSNDNGLEIALITYGATLTSVRFPDRNGRSEELTLGFDSLDHYTGSHPYFGTTVGRCANRIAGSAFTLDGTEYRLTRNEGRNHLHGGLKGLGRIVWRSEPFSEGGRAGVRFSCISPDGDDGYPGTLRVTVSYALTEANELAIEYTAETDRSTPVNLTNHAYWNLGGAGSGKILDHLLVLNADRYLPVDREMIPTGEIAHVAGTPLDFTAEKPIGRDIGKAGIGYDSCFVITRSTDGLVPAAVLRHPASGRVLRVSTDQPGIQFYSGNLLNGIPGRDGNSYGKHDALCLETGNFPDAVHHDNFPDPFIGPSETYRHHAVYALEAE